MNLLIIYCLIITKIVKINHLIIKIRKNLMNIKKLTMNNPMDSVKKRLITSRKNSKRVSTIIEETRNLKPLETILE